MFHQFWNFLKRHRRKCYFTAFIGGSYAAYRFLRWKLHQYQELQMNEAFTQVRKRQHFESNQRTCNTTVLSLIPSIRENIIAELDCEKLTNQLQQKPSNRFHIWSELKLMAYTRAIVAIYSVSIMTVVLRVQLNILSGCLYSQSSQEGTEPISNVTQQKYLESIQYFILTGLTQLMAAVRHGVERELMRISLKEQLGVVDIIDIIDKVRHPIERGNRGETQTGLLKFIFPEEPSEYTNRELARLRAETREILQSPDFSSVLVSTIDAGFQFFYNHQQRHISNSMTPAKGGQAAQLNKAALAKLVPSATGVFFLICSETANDFMQDFLTLETVAAFGQNVYEAFSTTPDSSEGT